MKQRMIKVWAILCTVAFAMFWVFGGFALMAAWDGSPLVIHVSVVSALGLGLGIYARRQLLALTRHYPRGQRVWQSGT